MLNEKVLKTARLSSTESILFQVQLHWAGHIARIEDMHMPKVVFLSKLQARKLPEVLQRPVEERAC